MREDDNDVDVFSYTVLGRLHVQCYELDESTRDNDRIYAETACLRHVLLWFDGFVRISMGLRLVSRTTGPRFGDLFELF